MGACLLCLLIGGMVGAVVGLVVAVFCFAAARGDR